MHCDTKTLIIQKKKRYWESKLESNRRPNDNDMDAWIRAKYERKLWIENGSLPNPTTIQVKYKINCMIFIF